MNKRVKTAVIFYDYNGTQYANSCPYLVPLEQPIKLSIPHDNRNQMRVRCMRNVGRRGNGYTRKAMRCLTCGSKHGYVYNITRNEQA